MNVVLLGKVHKKLIKFVPLDSLRCIEFEGRGVLKEKERSTNRKDERKRF